MRISKWGEYGILCCLYLAKRAITLQDTKNPVGAAELAHAQSIPLEYAQQILQKLRKGDVVDSVRGPGGGYRLSRESKDINLRDILVAAEGDTFEVMCDKNSIFEDCSNAQGACSLKAVWHELRETIDSYLVSKTLEELASEDLATGRLDVASDLVQLSAVKTIAE